MRRTPPTAAAGRALSTRAPALGDGKPGAVLAKAQQNHTKEVATGFTVTGPRAEARREEGSPPFQVTASRRAEWGDRHLLL